MVNDELNEMYEEIVMDHYHNPRNTDLISEPDFEVEKNNPFCGDEIKIQISLDENNKFNDLEEIQETASFLKISEFPFP